MKDNFSAQSDLYKKFRPTYPKSLYDYVLSLVDTKDFAWDCATGNGQVAGVLAEYFNKVYASDISQAQLENAVQKDNIDYVLCPAEKTPFADYQFDLITVAQAFHWFDFDGFFEEVRRVIKPGGVVAIWGYELMRIDEKIDPIVQRFYKEIVGPYWDFERKYVENHYSTIPFPLKDLKQQEFAIETRWTLSHLLGFLNSWSSVQKYIRQQGNNPVDFITEELSLNWSADTEKKVSFPVFVKVGNVY